LNSIDISTLWFGNPKLNANFSVELHEGTNALIFSIIMAMMVILYFFSGNINFFSKNRTIRVLAYIWIFQNAFLVISVFLRDYNYIDMHGLTYKRIGVIVFLLLCTIGLITVYIKVAQKKTLFYLFKTNGLIWYGLLLIFGIVNWDVLIVSYNINNRSSITLDLDHLTEMSDKTLPLLDQNRAVLKKYLSNSSYANDYIVVADTSAVTLPIDTFQRKVNNEKHFDQELNNRIKNFKIRYERTTWLSWNFRDWQTYNYIEKNKL